MKKKLHNGFLLVAMLLATVGSYVSCKDYDEEAYSNMLGENSKMKELLNAQIEALNESINVLNSAKCECDCNMAALEELRKEWEKAKKDSIVSKEVYETKIIEITGNIAAIQSDIDGLDKQEGRIYTAIEDANEALMDNMMDSIMLACDELSRLMDTKLSDFLKNNIEPLDSAIKDINVLIAGKADTTEITRLENMIKGLDERIKSTENLQSEIDSLESRVSTLETEMGKLSSIAHDVKNACDLAKYDSIRIDNLITSYNELDSMLQNMQSYDDTELREKIDSICGELKSVQDSANVALALARKNVAEANAYTDKRIKEAIDNLRGNTDSTLEQIEKAYKAADEKLQAQIDELEKSLAAVTARVEENEKKIDKLTGKVNKIDESLKQFITGIILQRAENPVFGSYSFPANIQTNILMAYYGYAGSYGGKDLVFPSYYPRYYVRESEALTQKDIEMLGIAPETLAGEGEALVSGAGKVYVTVNPSNVNFEGQTLPIVNSLDEESGIKLSGLKYSDKKLTFGATRAAVNGFYEAEATLAAEDIEKVKMTFDLNVGELKETVKDIINPLDGVNVTQVANTVYDVMNQFNQQLDANALKASWTDEMGVTRNIYSQYNLATTAIKPLSYAFMKDVNFTAFPGFDKMRNFAGKLLDKMADKFKVAIDGLPDFNFDIEHISAIELDSIEFNFDYNKLNLKVNYVDTIRTTASAEISIDTLIALDIEKLVNVPEQTFPVEVPVHGVVLDKDNKPVGELNTTVKDSITVPTQDILVCIQDSVPFKWSGVIDVVVDVPVDVNLEVDTDELKDLFKEIEGMEADINNLLAGQQDKVNEIIDMVNDYLDQLGDLTDLTSKFAEIGKEIDSTKDKVKDKIISYLDKLEDKLLTAVNSINKAVQPVMLVSTTSGFQVLSQTKYNPTIMSAANAQFIPTSYTAEIIAPAYKKLVGVTNVMSMDRSKSAQKGDADCLAALKAANAKEGVAEILDGDTQIVNFSAKKGYIYEVTYVSVDFDGLAAAKRYYVTVK